MTMGTLQRIVLDESIRREHIPNIPDVPAVLISGPLDILSTLFHFLSFFSFLYRMFPFCFCLEYVHRVDNDHDSILQADQLRPYAEQNFSDSIRKDPSPQPTTRSLSLGTNVRLTPCRNDQPVYDPHLCRRSPNPDSVTIGKSIYEAHTVAPAIAGLPWEHSSVEAK